MDMRFLVKVWRASDVEMIGLAGYSRKYVADVRFKESLQNGGFIYVRIPGGMKTDPHAHGTLEEIFIIMNKTMMGVGDQLLDVNQGDVVLVEPGEAHWFETPEGDDVVVIAIKFPNLKDDKIQVSKGKG
jgi:mannose-6-phosphate isomerase-like protein (cupin superfamily)